ncbi:hypothetical protein Tco_0756456 [Tanacetum coccineum]
MVSSGRLQSNGAISSINVILIRYLSDRQFYIRDLDAILWAIRWRELDAILYSIKTYPSIGIVRISSGRRLQPLCEFLKSDTKRSTSWLSGRSFIHIEVDDVTLKAP